MERLDEIVSIIDKMLNTKRKRHITGGILLSASLLFGGLAFTAFTIELKEVKHNDK
jgi:hypothetical protein